MCSKIEGAVIAVSSMGVLDEAYIKMYMGIDTRWNEIHFIFKEPPKVQPKLITPNIDSLNNLLHLI